MKFVLFLSLFVTMNAWSAEYGVGVDKLNFSLFFAKTAVPASSVIHFACRNIVNNRYLVNKDRSKVCWINRPEEFQAILKGLGQIYDRRKVVAAEVCPAAFKELRFCDPVKGRDF